MENRTTNIDMQNKTLTSGIVLVVMFVLSFSGIVNAQESKSLVVVGNSSGIPADMKLTELKSVFMGERQRWKNGDRVIIALMKTTTDAGKVTSTKVYGMSGNEVNKFWLALVFQGKAQAPYFFNSVDELERFVSQNPGAIGIIDKPVASSEIQSILVDGQKTF